METTRRISRSLILLACGVIFSTLTLPLALYPWGDSSPARAADTTASKLPDDFFVAPYPIPVGESTILIGSFGEFPTDTSLLVPSPGARSLRTERLSQRALALRLSVDSGTSGVTLAIETASGSKTLTVPVGPRLEPQIEVTSIAPDELFDSEVTTSRPALIYGFQRLDPGELAFVRIYNETTREWYQRIYEPRRPLSPLVDSDGNGIPDADDEDTRVVHGDFVGIHLSPGANRLHIACFRRDGRSSLEELLVLRE